jgi:glutathione S-transferase
MSTQIKPIKVWGATGPNPPKVIILLKELGVPYEVDPIMIPDAKKPEYMAVNPNGRLPAIQDPNTDLTLWESGAIIQYLVERYDTKHQLSFPTGSTESHLAKQWLFFQATGQGPYYGQLVWFSKYHAEKLPSAIERYIKEVNRVTGVLEGHLAEQKKKQGSGAGDGPWLVGNKLSYADLAFVPWQMGVGVTLQADQYSVDKYPHVKEWLGNMMKRENVKKAMEVAMQVMS